MTRNDKSFYLYKYILIRDAFLAFLNYVIVMICTDSEVTVIVML